MTMGNEVTYNVNTNQVIISTPGPQGPIGPSSSSTLYSSSAGIVTSASGIPTRWYGSFYSASTQTISNSSSAYAMVLGNTDFNNGVRNIGSSIIFDNSGIYNIQWSGQFQNINNGDQDVYIWLRKNGSNYAGSTGLVTVPSSHGGTDGHNISGWNYILSMNAGDYLQFYWGATSTDVTLKYYPAGTSPTRPDTVSLIVTAVQV